MKWVMVTFINNAFGHGCGPAVYCHHYQFEDVHCGTKASLERHNERQSISAILVIAVCCRD